MLPPTSCGVTNSPIVGMNTNKKAATMPGAAIGSVILTNARTRVAPRSVAASSKRRSMFSSATKIGSYGMTGAGKVVSSGDLIGVRGLGIYATVDVGNEANDYLAKIDPVTWKATPIGTGTGYNDIFGLAYWAGRSMEALLAGVKPADASTMAAAVGLSALMTIVGSVMPTLRALRVDPITALRAE